MKHKYDNQTVDLFGGGRMSIDDDYHVSGEFHADIAAKAIRNTSEIFQDRMKTLAHAIALCCEVFDGSYLRALYERVYVPLADDGTLAWEDRENLFPRPRECAYRRMSDVINVQLTLSGQRNYFTSAEKAYLFGLGRPLEQVAPLRKGTHDLVWLHKSDLHTPVSWKRVSPKLREAIRAMLAERPRK